ncbi:SinR family protein [Microbacterium sulfonylureivorans]|uniref:SinR family protein n=1 Tax=Microbacterium sulfonylureivorans TaxID=2486854 RepID=UPI000FD94CDF|nr:SinR family protein [Microbacterium sulfonylureivorans]
MTTYMVGYDLGKPGRDYDGLHEYLKSFRTYWHNLDSTWLVVTSESAEQLRNGAGRFLDNSDKLLVCQVTTPGAWRGFGESGSEWLMKYL